MILSCSRRSDIPAFYSEWFFRRLKEGQVSVRNPMNPAQTKSVSLKREDVDGFVFWSKDPRPLLSREDELAGYPFYVQWTLTPYGRDVEPNVPGKGEILIPAMKQFAARLGRERFVWRYDPILLNENYTLDYHKKYFRAMAGRIAESADSCIISFLDLYRGIEKRLEGQGIRAPSQEEMCEIAESFSGIAGMYGLRLSTCAEKIDLERYGIHRAACIDADRLSRIAGRKILAPKDQNQRPECGCAASLDLGAYHTCLHGCLYCYACGKKETVRRNYEKHDPASPFLLDR